MEETGWLAGRSSDGECPPTLFDEAPRSDEGAIPTAVHEGDIGEVDHHCGVACRRRGEQLIVAREITLAFCMDDAAVGGGPGLAAC